MAFEAAIKPDGDRFIQKVLLLDVFSVDTKSTYYCQSSLKTLPHREISEILELNKVTQYVDT